MLDLHVHSYYSDGSLSPTDLVNEAHAAGLDLIALTDHDHVGGVPEAQQAARAHGMAVIPGVEINTNHEDREVHVLGYFLDTANQVFCEALARQRHGRRERTRLMVDKLQQQGVRIDLADVVGKPELDSTLGRPHVAAALVKAGSVAGINDAFKQYLGVGKTGYVPQLGMKVAEAIALIRQAGGMAVLAHPGLWGANAEHLSWLVGLGLGGIEVYYPRHSPAQQAQYRALAEQHGLIMTGSSDYHGPVQHSAGPLGGTPIPADVVARFRALAAEKGYAPLSG